MKSVSEATVRTRILTRKDEDGITRTWAIAQVEGDTVETYASHVQVTGALTTHDAGAEAFRQCWGKYRSACGLPADEHVEGYFAPELVAMEGGGSSSRLGEDQR